MVSNPSEKAWRLAGNVKTLICLPIINKSAGLGGVKSLLWALALKTIETPMNLKYLIPLLLLVGCASNSGVVPMGNDTYID